MINENNNNNNNNNNELIIMMIEMLIVRQTRKNTSELWIVSSKGSASKLLPTTPPHLCPVLNYKYPTTG